MLNKYYKYLPWLILDAFVSYGELLITLKQHLICSS